MCQNPSPPSDIVRPTFTDIWWEFDCIKHRSCYSLSLFLLWPIITYRTLTVLSLNLEFSGYPTESMPHILKLGHPINVPRPISNYDSPLMTRNGRGSRESQVNRLRVTVVVRPGIVREGRITRPDSSLCLRRGIKSSRVSIPCETEGCNGLTRERVLGVWGRRTGRRYTLWITVGSVGRVETSEEWVPGLKDRSTVEVHSPRWHSRTPEQESSFHS